MRAVATRSPRPALASQAEKARRIIGAIEKLEEFSCRVQSAKAMNRDSIIPSKHKRADKRWVRWNVSPIRPSVNVEEKAKWAGVIRLLWNLATSF